MLISGYPQNNSPKVNPGINLGINSEQQKWLLTATPNVYTKASKILSRPQQTLKIIGIVEFSALF